MISVWYCGEWRLEVTYAFGNVCLKNKVLWGNETEKYYQAVSSQAIWSDSSQGLLHMSFWWQRIAISWRFFQNPFEVLYALASIWRPNFTDSKMSKMSTWIDINRLKLFFLLPAFQDLPGLQRGTSIYWTEKIIEYCLEETQMTKFLSFSPNYKEENKKYSLKYYCLKRAWKVQRVNVITLFCFLKASLILIQWHIAYEQTANYRVVL